MTANSLSPQQERLHRAIIGVLLDAGASGVKWGTELPNTAEGIVEVVTDWLEEERQREEGPTERQIEQQMNAPSLAERMAPPITYQDRLK